MERITEEQVTAAMELVTQKKEALAEANAAYYETLASFNRQVLAEKGIIEGKTICLAHIWYGPKVRCVITVDHTRGQMFAREVTKAGSIWKGRRPFTPKDIEVEVKP